MLVMAFSATLALSLMFSVLSVLKVSASKEVSQTDLPGETALAQPVQDHLSEPIRSEEKGNVTVTRQAPDLILSNQTALKRNNGAKFNKFLPSASYNGSYRSELDDNEKKIFDGLYQSLVVQRNPSNEIIHHLIAFTPPETFRHHLALGTDTSSHTPLPLPSHGTGNLQRVHTVAWSRRHHNRLE